MLSTTKKRVLYYFFYSFLILLPKLSSADIRIPASIVPCGTSATGGCELCHIFELAHNIIDFLLFAISGPLAVLMFIIGGFMILTAGDSPQRYSQGLNIIKNTLWGLAIGFFAWVIVNTIIVVIGPNPRNSAGNILRNWSEPPGAFCAPAVSPTPAVSPPPAAPLP